MGTFSLILFFTSVLISNSYGRFYQNKVNFKNGMGYVQVTEFDNLNALTPVNLTIFYEARDFGSSIFFTKTLIPLVHFLDSNITLDLKPIAESMSYTDGHWVFECSDEDMGCLYDKYHACALNLNITDDNKLNFVVCLMGVMDNSSVETCANKTGISASAITDCANSTEGEAYLSNYTQDAMNADTPVTQIPTILINGMPYQQQNGRRGRQISSYSQEERLEDSQEDFENYIEEYFENYIQDDTVNNSPDETESDSQDDTESDSQDDTESDSQDNTESDSQDDTESDSQEGDLDQGNENLEHRRHRPNHHGHHCPHGHNHHNGHHQGPHGHHRHNGHNHHGHNHHRQEDTEHYNQEDIDKNNQDDLENYSQTGNLDHQGLENLEHRRHRGHRCPHGHHRHNGHHHKHPHHHRQHHNILKRLLKVICKLLHYQPDVCKIVKFKVTE